jgi:hypothetical protein
MYEAEQMLDIQPLNTLQLEELTESINDFQDWIQIKLPISPQTSKNKITFFTQPDDWVMRVSRSNEVEFNLSIAAKCNFDYFRMTILHECFHLFVQGVPNKVDAKRLRDDFGGQMMNLIDIEADYYAALYLKEKHDIGIIDILKWTYEGSKIFGDPKIRNIKVERFLGSILSIANMFIGSVDDRDTLFLPSISNLTTDGSVHIILFKQSHLTVGTINADLNDFVKLRDCYTRGGELYSIYGYSMVLVDFACKALSLTLPDSVRNKLNDLL